jgi:hypothetical protein
MPDAAEFWVAIKMMWSPDPQTNATGSRRRPPLVTRWPAAKVLRTFWSAALSQLRATTRYNYPETLAAFNGGFASMSR